MDIYGNEVIQVYPKKGKKYPVILRELTDDTKVTQNLISIESKPLIIKYNGNKFIVGDDTGKVLVFRVKDKKTVLAKESHSESIEDIIWDVSGHFFKTISGS